MKRLHFDYTMKMSYTIPVSICNYTIKCIPVSDERQTLLEHHIELMPESKINYGQDSFGNRQIYGRVGEEHEEFSFHIDGDVLIEQILYEDTYEESSDMMFAYSYNLNKAGVKIQNYFNSLAFTDDMTDYDKSIAIMHSLYKDFIYQPNITKIDTSAEEAFEIGKGVCQDYSHIMIALLHLAGIPARYVTGMLIGEGASHAWVEVLWHDKWIGMDPTNDVLVAESHIKLGHGRDASDCLINRGVMKGGGQQTQEIVVSVHDA